MRAERPRVLLMGAYGQDNLGDEAILEVHLQQLKEFPITVVSSNPEDTERRYGVPAVRTYGGNRARTLKAFLKSDVLVYGGGSLVKELNPPYFRYRLVANLTVAGLAAKTCGKGVAMSAMGVERLRTRTARFLARRAVNLSDLMLVRDEGSCEKVKGIGARRRAVVTADPAYLLEEDEAARARAEAILAPLGDGPLVILNPICSSEVACPEERVAESFAAVANRAISTIGAQVLLLPFKTKGEDNDVDISREVAARVTDLSRVHVAPLDLRPSEVVALLRRARLFAGMRHHGVLLALTAGAPVLPVPYAEKTENLVAEFGLSRYGVPAHELTPAKLVAAFDAAEASRDEVLATARAHLDTMRERAQENFRRLKEYIDARAA